MVSSSLFNSLLFLFTVYGSSFAITTASSQQQSMSSDPNATSTSTTPEWLLQAQMCFFMSSSSTWCSRTGGQDYTQLTVKLAGDSTYPSSMINECGSMDGIIFNSGLSCMVQGQYTQLAVKQLGDTSWPSSMSNECATLGGVSFGNGLFCAVKGEYTQLSTKLPGDTTYLSSMMSQCNQLGGVSFGNGLYCAVQGKYTQLSTKYPGSTSWESFGNACSQINGMTMDEFCIVQGEYTQLSSFVPGVGNSFVSDLNTVCQKYNGVTFGSFCAVPGAYTQLIGALPGDLSYNDITNFCISINGDSIGNIICIKQGRYSQGVSRLPGFSSSVSSASNWCPDSTNIFGFFDQYCLSDRYQSSTMLASSTPEYVSMENTCTSMKGTSFVYEANCLSSQPSDAGKLSSSFLLIVSFFFLGRNF